MSELLSILLSVPTVLFSVGLGLAAAYWALAVIGAVDLEIIDGAIDGALDGAVDGALDGAMDGALDGVVDGAADGAVDGAVEGAGDPELSPEATGGAVLWLANVLRLGRVPATVSLSAFVLWGWVAAFVLTWAFQRYGPELVPPLVFGVGALLLCSAVAAAVTNVTVRPLEPLFRTAQARERRDLVGEACEISTGQVDASFGQATLQLGGDALVVQVRCDTPGQLRRGDRALIVHFDTHRDAFVVEPLALRQLEARAPQVVHTHREG